MKFIKRNVNDDKNMHEAKRNLHQNLDLLQYINPYNIIKLITDIR